MANRFSIHSDCFITPSNKVGDSYLLVEKGKIKGFSSSAEGQVIELKDKIVMPALVDAHDHLFGNYYPKIGRTDGSYKNWKEWDDELKVHKYYKERSKIPPSQIYNLAAYKHIVSGCTTVNDHMPHFISNQFVPTIKVPIRIQKNFALAHESSSYDLRWGDGIIFEHDKALKDNIPFITHIEEGYDEEAKKGIDILLLLGALSDHTVLIHGIALSDQDIDEIAKHGATMVWCPGSNWYMFRRTGAVKQWLEKGINVALGTDSPHTGELNLLYEMRWAKQLYKQIYGEDIPDKTLVEMITINAAKALRLDKDVGSLDEGRCADITVITGNKSDPYKSVREADFAEIALVFHEGKPVYGDAEYADVFKSFKIKARKVSIAGKEKVINGDPAGLMKKIRKHVGFRKVIPFLPVD